MAAINGNGYGNGNGDGDGDGYGNGYGYGDRFAEVAAEGMARKCEVVE